MEDKLTSKSNEAKKKSPWAQMTRPASFEPFPAVVGLHLSPYRLVHRLQTICAIKDKLASKNTKKKINQQTK